MMMNTEMRLTINVPRRMQNKNIDKLRKRITLCKSNY